jgi:murein DD-endopeptidase MepM/ murein hydrolase activator NlpD
MAQRRYGTGSGHAYDGHNGTDTGLPNGTALYAIAPGTVTSLAKACPTTIIPTRATT